MILSSVASRCTRCTRTRWRTSSTVSAKGMISSVTLGVDTTSFRRARIPAANHGRGRVDGARIGHARNAGQAEIEDAGGGGRQHVELREHAIRPHHLSGRGEGGVEVHPIHHPLDHGSASNELELGFDLVSPPHPIEHGEGRHVARFAGLHEDQRGGFVLSRQDHRDESDGDEHRSRTDGHGPPPALQHAHNPAGIDRWPRIGWVSGRFWDRGWA